MTKPIRLIIADDEMLIRTGLKIMLEASGNVEVLALAENGRAAFEACTIHRPDVVLMDIRMPESNGIEGTKLIKEAFPEVEVIAGTATAGIPHGAIIADKMNLPFAYIRSKPKDHGAGNQIEGRVAQGQKMVVVEDLISTGGSVLEAVAAAKREGADVLGVVAIFSYQLPKADKNFADAGVKLVTLSNYSELIHLAQEEGYITPEGLDLLKRFKEDQENWQEG